MGRLSEARKKAKANRSGSGVGTGNSDAVHPHAASAKGTSQASRELESPTVSTASTEMKPGSNQEPPNAPVTLPPAGLADEILAELANQSVASSPVTVNESPEPAKRREGGLDLLESIRATAMSSEESAKCADEAFSRDSAEQPLLSTLNEAIATASTRPLSLPSSGLAEEILQIIDRPPERPIMHLDEAHEFESLFEEEKAIEQTQLVLFQVGHEVFALEIERIQEIIRVPAMTRVPGAPAFVRGVCNLRGRIVPVIDMRARLGIETRPIDRSTRIIVVEPSASRRVGLLIDRVCEVARIAVPDIEPPPEELLSVAGNAVAAVAKFGGDMLFLLDLDRTLTVPV